MGQSEPTGAFVFLLLQRVLLFFLPLTPAVYRLTQRIEHKACNADCRANALSPTVEATVDPDAPSTTSRATTSRAPVRLTIGPGIGSRKRLTRLAPVCIIKKEIIQKVSIDWQAVCMIQMEIMQKAYIDWRQFVPPSKKLRLALRRCTLILFNRL